MLVRRAGDNQSIDGRICQRALQSGGSRAMPRSQPASGVSYRVDNVFKGERRVRRDVRRMNATNATGADDGESESISHF